MVTLPELPRKWVETDNYEEREEPDRTVRLNETNLQDIFNNAIEGETIDIFVPDLFPSTRLKTDIRIEADIEADIKRKRSLSTNFTAHTKVLSDLVNKIYLETNLTSLARVSASLKEHLQTAVIEKVVSTNSILVNGSVLYLSGITEPDDVITKAYLQGRIEKQKVLLQYVSTDEVIVWFNGSNINDEVNEYV